MSLFQTKTILYTNVSIILPVEYASDIQITKINLLKYKLYNNWQNTFVKCNKERNINEYVLEIPTW